MIEYLSSEAFFQNLIESSNAILQCNENEKALYCTELQ